MTAFSGIFSESLDEHQALFQRLETLAVPLESAANRLCQALKAGHKVLACGNGGSAADAQHFAAELTGRFETQRRGLPAVALTTDSSALTAIGNDFGFQALFARQVEALGRPGDVLLAISTSGHSENVLEAVKTARQCDMAVIGLLGRDGGSLAALCDVSLVVPEKRTARIQEAHIFLLHVLCSAVDEAFTSA